MTKLKNLDLKGKKVLIRADLNVSSRTAGKIKKEDKLIASLETIKYVMDHGGIPIVMSHLGRPGGKVDQKYDMKPVAEALESKLGTNVTLAPDCIGGDVEKLLENAQSGDAFLLQNLRFHPEEEANDPVFVQQLAKLGEVYINDAFGTAHREHASTYGVPLLFKEQKKPVAAGLLMQKEIDLWSDAMQTAEPKYLCLGGAKLKEKIKALEKLSKEFNKVYVGGLVYNVIRAAQGRGIGSSKATEKDEIDYIAKTKAFLPNLENIVMPDYLMIAKTSKNKFTDEKKIKESEEIPKGYDIIDCIYKGEKLKAFKKANLVVAFGPLGIFEDPRFREGTDTMAKAFNNAKKAILGGGESGQAYKLATKAYVSTGGGASAKFLIEKVKGKELSAVKVLK